MDDGNGPQPQHENGKTLDAKNTKSQRKKKSKSGGKKSRKKDSAKRSPSPQSNSDSFENITESQGTSGPDKKTKRKKGTKGLEKATKVKEEEERQCEENLQENEPREEQEHSNSRSRSTSRSRFSSLFRRKKKCKSETDLRKRDNEEKEDENQEEPSDNLRRKETRHVSTEDLKRKRREGVENEKLSVPVKSSLKPPSPYHEFPSKTQPRDRLQHMTLKQVTKEQRERRSESVPRRRRTVSDDDLDSRPGSSSNLTGHPGDRSPSSPKYVTLPRTGHPSLTDQHSPNHPYAGSPASIPSPSSAGGSIHFFPGNYDTSKPYNSIDSPEDESQTRTVDNASRLQRPPDSLMESSQDSGVVVVAGESQSAKPHRRDSTMSNRTPKPKQEKSSMEKLLELRQRFPHAFSDNMSGNVCPDDAKIEDTVVVERGIDDVAVMEQEQKSHVDEKDQVRQPEIVPNSAQSDTKTKTSASGDLDSSPKRETNKTFSSPQSEFSSPQSDSNDKKDTKPDSPPPQSSQTAHSPVSPSSAPSQPSTSVSRQQLARNTLASLNTNSTTPSFLIPYSDGGDGSGSSSRVTSMTSSHRSSDQGYVDGDSVPDDDDDDDDDNSAFSTPPEDLISDSKISSLNPEVLHKFLSSVTQNVSETNDLFCKRSDDNWNEEILGNKESPNGMVNSSTLDNIPNKGRKASINLKRSKSDVDRRNYKSPRTFSGKFASKEEPVRTRTPVGSIETFSNVSSFSLTDNLFNSLGDGDKDRDSLVSTVTLTHMEPKASEPQPRPELDEREDRVDAKPVPVMGTTAQQQIYRRNVSPMRARKMYKTVIDIVKEPSQKEIPLPSLQDWNRSEQTLVQNFNNRPSSVSFQTTPPPKGGYYGTSVHPEIAHEDKKDISSLGEPGVSSNIQNIEVASTLGLNKSFQPIFTPLMNNDIESRLQPQPVSPTYILTGLELQPESPMSTKSKTLMDCLNNQSLLGQRKEENKKKDVENVKGKTILRRSFRTERELKETGEEKDEKDEKRPLYVPAQKPVATVDKECQTPPWLLDDLREGRSPKKSKGILSKRKKQAVGWKNMAPLKIPVSKEELQRSSTEFSPPTAENAQSIDDVFLTPPMFADSGDNKPAPEIVPVSPESGIASLPTSPTLAKQIEETEDPKTSEDASSPQISQPDTEENTENLPCTSNDRPKSPKPKSKISLSAIILLKNRIAKYRERKKSVRDIQIPEEDKVEADLPSDTFMTIENEINLSKLEVSRETDILDADYFEPEFSLDYTKKQLRFDSMNPVEPVQSEEPLPPLPPALSRRLRQRRKSTMIERRRKCVSYCKRFVAFLFSHIGLCSLVVAYTIMGGFIFQALESQAETALKVGIKEKRTQVLGQIVSMALELEKTEEGVDNLTSKVNSTLLQWQSDIHQATKDQGWDGTEKMGNEGVWTFASSLLYAITVTTTIGYGHVAPKTPQGRLVTIAYAVVGIPLTLLCLTNIGDVMATGFRLLYGKVCCGVCCTMFKPRRRRIPPDLEKGLPRTMVTTEKEESDKPKEVIHVPTSLCLLLIAAYIFAGAMLFSMWENWDILTGSYFCFITLSTIGFGDIVPGMESNEWSGEEKLVLCALYLVMGLSLIAMCFNLVQEDVKTKCRWLGMKLGIVDKPETPI